MVDGYCTVDHFHNPQKETATLNILICVRYYRFSSLFHDDKLGHCFDKDDLSLTLTTLQLLYHLVRSPSIAELLCLHNDVACLPLTCYQCLVDPVSNLNPNSPPTTDDKDIMFKIRLQVHVYIMYMYVYCIL